MPGGKEGADVNSPEKSQREISRSDYKTVLAKPKEELRGQIFRNGGCCGDTAAEKRDILKDRKISANTVANSGQSAANE